MQMVANAAVVIMEQFVDSEYYGVTPHTYVPHIFNVTASVAAFDKQMAVNVRGVMLCYKHAARQMLDQGRGGRIIGATVSYCIERMRVDTSKAHPILLHSRRIFHGWQAR
jgi:NAD(P)-dependent dehydrogenase (short-subunit alcohol dehydrogenase family)